MEEFLKIDKELLKQPYGSMGTVYFLLQNLENPKALDQFRETLINEQPELKSFRKKILEYCRIYDLLEDDYVLVPQHYGIRVVGLGFLEDLLKTGSPDPDIIKKTQEKLKIQRSRKENLRNKKYELPGSETDEDFEFSMRYSTSLVVSRLANRDLNRKSLKNASNFESFKEQILPEIINIAVEETDCQELEDPEYLLLLLSYLFRKREELF